MNNSESGESSGRLGRLPRAGAFSVCEVVICTTVGSSRAVSCENEVGALGRGVMGAAGLGCASAGIAPSARQKETRRAGRMRMVEELWDSQLQSSEAFAPQTG